jgi:hypothetical protein
VHPGSSWTYNPLWTLGYLAYPFVVLGPPMGILLFLAIRDAWRQRLQQPDRWLFVSFSLHTAIPIFAFYLLLSFKTDIELNWAVAGYTVLMIPTAWYLNDRLANSRAIKRLWRTTLGFGLAMAFVISFGKWPMQRLSQLDIAGYHIPADRALQRVTGHKDIAQRVAKLSRTLERETGAKPFIVAAGYSRASLLAFYMPDRPHVRCAGALMGGRATAYDYFKDTSLSEPGLLGRPAILIGGTAADWNQALAFKTIIRSAYPGRIFAAYNYGGPHP